MNALDKIGLNSLPLRLDARLSGIAAGLGARTAGTDGGSIAQQQPGGLSTRTPDNPLFTPPLRALNSPSSLATVSMDARVLDALARLPGELALIVADKPLCPVPPKALGPSLTTPAGGNPGADSNADSNVDSKGQTASTTAGAPLHGGTLNAPQTASSAFTGLLAHALMQSLENSGLFYESHLAQWASGQRPLNSLDHEPQARFAPGVGNGATIHPDLVQTVRQQMELLQNPVLRWSGEAWPGAKMDWAIERRDEKRDDGAAWNHGDGVEPSWRMQLSLNLPRLGAVEAELQLAGNRLVARLKAEPDSAASLLHESEDLRRRLNGTGLELKSLAVRERVGRAGP
jgi:hypothetical protein